MLLRHVCQLRLLPPPDIRRHEHTLRFMHMEMHTRRLVPSIPERAALSTEWALHQHLKQPVKLSGVPALLLDDSSGRHICIQSAHISIHQWNIWLHGSVLGAHCPSGRGAQQQISPQVPNIVKVRHKIKEEELRWGGGWKRKRGRAYS